MDHAVQRMLVRAAVASVVIGSFGCGGGAPSVTAAGDRSLTASAQSTVTVRDTVQHLSTSAKLTNDGVRRCIWSTAPVPSGCWRIATNRAAARPIWNSDYREPYHSSVKYGCTLQLILHDLQPAESLDFGFSSPADRVGRRFAAEWPVLSVGGRAHLEQSEPSSTSRPVRSTSRCRTLAIDTKRVNDADSTLQEARLAHLPILDEASEGRAPSMPFAAATDLRLHVPPELSCAARPSSLFSRWLSRPPSLTKPQPRAAAVEAAGAVTATSIQPGEECPPGTTEIRPRSCMAPEIPAPSILDYRPKSTLVAPVHMVPKAKYPAIDFHGHPQGLLELRRTGSTASAPRSTA